MNIKDYLHYYIGQKYRTKYVDLDGPNHWLILTAKRLDKLDDLSIEWVQLALRKLEDMTDQEAFDLCEFQWPVEVTKYIRAQRGVVVEFRRKHSDPEMNNADGYTYSAKAINWGLNHWTTYQFHYLLSRGFDLFGLIPAGLAIDAKTLNTPNNGENN